MKIAIFLISLFLIGQMVVVFFNDKTASEGYKLEAYRKQANDLKLENEVLRDQIAHYSSLMEVEKEAYLLGFRPVKQITWYK